MPYIEPMESRLLMAVWTVDPSGSGTTVRKTIQDALRDAPSGSTINIKPGTYRAIPDQDMAEFRRNNIVLQAASGPGTVHIKGSALVSSDFQLHSNNGTSSPLDDIYYIPDWTGRYFDPQTDDPDISNDARKKVRNQFFVGASDANPGGDYLRMYDSISALRSANFANDSTTFPLQGGFYIERHAGGNGVHHVYIRMRDGSDPDAGGRAVEGTVVDTPLLNTNGMDNLTIRNLSFYHGANVTQAQALVRVTGNSNKVTLDRISVSFAHGAGITVNDSTNVTVQDSRFDYNGQEGLHGNNLGGTVQFLRNSTSYNNQLPGKTYGTGWEAGGFKVSNSAGTLFDGHVSAYNGGNGLWFDVGDDNITVRNSVSHHNASQGMSYEISYGGKIYNNVFYNNAGDGLIIHASAYCEVYNNTMYGNGLSGLQLKAALRPSGPYNVTTYGNKIFNNIIANNQADANWNNNEKSVNIPYRPGRNLPTVPDANPAYEVTYNLSDHNLYWLDPSLGGMQDEFFIGDSTNSNGVGLRLRTIDAYQANGGYASEMHSRWGDPKFVNPSAGDFRLSPGSAALGIGASLDLASSDREGIARPVGIYDAGAAQLTTPVLPTGWRKSNLSVVFAGHAYAGRDGTFYLNGAGTTIGGVADQATFLWQDLIGNGVVSAKYISNSESGGQAVAGVMFRDSTDPDSPYVALLRQDGGNLITLSYRTASGHSSMSTSVAVAGEVALKLVREGPAFKGYYSTDAGNSWSAVGAAQVPAISVTAKAGLVANSYSNQTASLSTFQDVFLGGLPVGMTSRDVGGPALAGLSYEDGGRYSVAGAGSGIGGASDQFHYASGDVNGDTTLIVRIDSQDGAASAKAGLMFRETTGAGAKFAGVFVRPDGVVEFQRRDSTGGAVASDTASAGSGTRHLKLVRSGSNFSAYYSSDGGVSWSQVGTSRAVAMGASVKAGLATTSQNTGAVNHAVFSGYLVRGAPADVTDTTIGSGSGTVMTAPSGAAHLVETSDAGINGSQDGLRYLHKSYGNDVILTTRIDRLTATHANARAGLMIRPSVIGDRKYVALSVDKNNRVIFQYRTTDAGVPTQVSTPTPMSGPVYLRLSRMYFLNNGEQYTYAAHYSADGQTWTQLGTFVAVSISAKPYLGGIFATSGSTGATATAAFAAVGDQVLTDAEAVLAPAPVAADATGSLGSFQVNDVVEAQRSMVKTLNVRFSRQVQLNASALKVRDSAGTLVPVTLETSPDGISYRLTFSGTSLADGRYSLAVDAEQISDYYGNAVYASQTPFSFHRLFGDANGDARVDMADNRPFVAALNGGASGYKWYFDFNNDGKIDMADNRAFVSRLGVSI